MIGLPEWNRKLARPITFPVLPCLYNCCLWALYKMDMCHKSKGCKCLFFLVTSILQKTITITRVRFHMRLLNIFLSDRQKHKKVPPEEKKSPTSTLVYAHMATCELLSPGVYTKHHNAALYTVTRGNFKVIIGAAAPCFFFCYFFTACSPYISQNWILAAEPPVTGGGRKHGTLT